MRAIDTNIVLRVIARDDPLQSPKARALVEAGDVFVPLTVVLEVEWVLRRTYRYAPGDVALGISAFASLPGVTMEHPDRVAFALDRSLAGMDFADALHLASATRCEEFLTFDQAFVRDAAQAPGGPPVRDAGRAPA